MVLVEHAAGLGEVEVVRRRLRPRQRQDPLEIGADDAVLRGGGRELLEARELAAGRPRGVLRQVELGEPLPQLVDLRLLRVTFSELLLNRLQLLAQEELPLALLQLRLHLRLDLRPQLEDLELATEDDRDLPEPGGHVGQLEQPLLLVRRQAQRGRDEVRERARVLDVRGRDLQLLGEVRDESDDAREEGLDVSGQGLELPRLGDDVRHLLDLRDEVGVVLEAARDPDPLQPCDEDPQRPVRDLHHLLDRGGGADLVQVVPARLVRVPAFHGDEREQAVVSGDDVVDELDRALLPDRERRPRLREDDGLLQRQDGQLLRDRDADVRLGWSGLAHGRVRISIGTLTPRGGRFASGRTIVSSPVA